MLLHSSAVRERNIMRTQESVQFLYLNGAKDNKRFLINFNLINKHEKLLKGKP